MSYPIEISVKAKNYKCIGDEPQGFDAIYPINIIIGRNNSGKSALLDLINYVTTPHDINSFGHKQKTPEVLLTREVGEDIIEKTFNRNASGGGIPGRTHFEYGSSWINKPVTIKLLNNKNQQFVSIEPPFDNVGSNIIAKYANTLANSIQFPFKNRIFKRLLSDRDIKPEGDTSPPTLQANGEGATNIIQQFINKTHLNSTLVENDLLKALNVIFKGDSEFTDLVTQHNANTKHWEIYLEEKEKGRIPLSSSGSGLKTIILVLINIILTPALEAKNLNDYIFAFEELENNLHPALQRKLFLYIQQIAKDQNCHFLISTHSNIVIDLFSKYKEAQIIHVTHNKESASCNRVKTYIDNKGILDDLDVRASDLLQANCIVWVEGPSDRLYFNRWISLWTNDQIKEGTHYQCVFYGGRLLAHLFANEGEESETNGIEILKVNKNAIILIDSDKKSKLQRLNKTKKRIKSEVESVDGIAWVTKGKEIENYIPNYAFKKYFEKEKLKQLNLYENVADYLNKIQSKEGIKYLNNKVLFAEKICAYLTKDSLENVLDLKEKINIVCDKIRNWNKF